MSDYPNIILLHRPCLTAFGVDSDHLAEKMAAWPNVAEAIVVNFYSEFDLVDLPAQGRIFRVGPVAGSESDESDAFHWFDVDVPLLLPWLYGPRDEAILALIRSALDGAAVDKVSTQASPPNLNVLVYGRGAAAKAAVDAIKEAGLDVMWAGANAEDSAAGVEILPCKSLTDIHGWAGRFTVTLKTDNGQSRVDTGALVLAGSATRVSVDKATTQSSMTLSAWTETAVPSNDGAGILAFVCGVEKSTSVRNMARVLESAFEATEKFSKQVYVFAPQIKVAGFSLERLYGRAREAGVVFIRTARTGPETTTGPDGKTTLSAYDPLAQADLHLTPDMIVWEDSLQASPELTQWALPLADDGFVGPDNVLFLSAGTMRRGIYAIGPARGTDSDETLRAEVNGLVSEIMDVFNATEQDIVRHVNLCGRCLTCVRICPVGAIDITAESWFVPNACVACGLCASQCPAGAITLSGSSDRKTSARLKPLLDRPKASDDAIPRIVLFGCERSVMQAMKTSTVPDSPMDVIVSPIPCGCRADETSVLKALALGADAVLIGTCHAGNCRTDRGTEAAQSRAARIRGMVQGLGYRPERIGTISLAPNMGADFSRAVTGFAAGLNAPIPESQSEEDLS